MPKHVKILIHLANNDSTASVFLFDPRKEFNMHIDAPMEEKEAGVAL